MSTGDQLAKSIMITGNTWSAIRWEALGLLFTWATLALLHSPTDDRVAANFIATHGTNKASCISTMMYCSNLCISLCKEYAPTNEVLLWLLPLEHIHQAIIIALETLQHSYNKLIVLGHQTWQRLGDLATEALDPTIVKPGAGNRKVPFFLSQSRRKIIASAYWMDKSLASFHGQIPRIPCLPQDFEIPLDIDDDALLAKGFPRSESLHSRVHDSNQSDSVCSATYIRARYILGGFRDELLQLSHAASSEYNGNNGLHDHSPSPVELIRNISALISSLEHEYHSDDQLSLPYIKTYRNLGCALNDILESKEICALGCDTGPSSSIISPGSGIFGNDNIGSQSIDWGDDLGWNMQRLL
ncbi:hypothetical protein BDV32DRAFT_157774 [Aspergillus pseudonomiae]|nr:hypothetical protein BDV32DRAFT_157774 [Aspergillus pseudonomiae]